VAVDGAAVCDPVCAVPVLAVCAVDEKADSRSPRSDWRSEANDGPVLAAAVVGLLAAGVVAAVPLFVAEAVVVVPLFVAAAVCAWISIAWMSEARLCIGLAGDAPVVPGADVPPAAPV
jgi:hypothetical protein